MTEYRLHPAGEIPYVSTYDFHADRERAPHLEQPIHRDRLNKAYEYARYAAGLFDFEPVYVSDLGCGDGGLLQLLKDADDIEAYGYDFQPSNQEGWEQRGVKAAALDVFGVDREDVALGEIAICTEVLEHLADPHGALDWIANTSRFVVASSPHTETNVSHDACHAWAWDFEGYEFLLADHGWRVIRHEKVGMFQVILGESQHA